MRMDCERRIEEKKTSYKHGLFHVCIKTEWIIVQSASQIDITWISSRLVVKLRGPKVHHHIRETPCSYFDGKRGKKRCNNDKNNNG